MIKSWGSISCKVFSKRHITEITGIATPHWKTVARYVYNFRIGKIYTEFVFSALVFDCAMKKRREAWLKILFSMRKTIRGYGNKLMIFQDLAVLGEDDSKSV